MSSIAYFHMRDETGLVRIPHQEGFHLLIPWPWFDGCDEVFPPCEGVAAHDLGGIKVQPSLLVHAVTYLCERSNSMQVGIRSDFFGSSKHHCRA
jgi:hypothetical protein